MLHSQRNHLFLVRCVPVDVMGEGGGGCILLLTFVLSTIVVVSSVSSFNKCRLLMSHLGLLSWENRKHIHMLEKSEQMMRILKQLDKKVCSAIAVCRCMCCGALTEYFSPSAGWCARLPQGGSVVRGPGAGGRTFNLVE